MAELIIDRNYYNKLDIEGFSKMMSSPSYSYKFYWLEAIVQLISANRTEVTYDEIINKMIVNACRTHILSNEEYIVALEAKLNEEVAEYQADKNLEEMADVLEVLHAICVARGYSLAELEAMRANKAEKRGGFKEKIFLEYVEEKR